MFSIKILLERYLFLLNASAIPLKTASKSALWIIDEKNSPGGYPIEESVYKVAKDLDIDIIRFDSKFNFFVLLYNFILKLPLIIKSRDINKFTEIIVNKELNKNNNIEYIITGSCNSFVASVIHNSSIPIKIIEIQHGQIDESYIPVRADIFYSRSEKSKKLLEDLHPGADIRNISSEYDIPKYNKKSLTSQHQIKQIYFWSKNPNGGISWRELVILENEIFDLSQKLNINLSFKIHPRDNKLKFLFRHLFFNEYKNMKFIRILKIFFTKKLTYKVINTFKNNKTLHISCFSTSLISEPKTHDYVINIINERPQIVLETYSWLSSINLSKLKNVSFPFEVTEIM
tara:strand:+ start:23833 stop:24864 length:1032 start_codon:yes stop_codon:yes gene_type:complete